MNFTLKKVSIVLVILLLALAGSLLFQRQLVAMYNNFGQRVQQFQKTDLGNIVEELKKEIFAPDPLNIGGSANNSVLVASKIIIETNAARRDNGNLPALTVNAELTAAAKAKADDMFAKQYFEHVSPSGVGPGQLVQAYGYDYIVTGENLILGNFKDEAQAVQLWMNSPGHRANILNNRFTEIGVAMVKGTYKGQTAWIGVQEFGLPISVCPQPNQATEDKIQANKATLSELAVNIEAKRAEINKTDSRSEKYNQLVDEYNALVAQYNTLNDLTKELIAKYNAQVNVFNACVKGK